MEVAAHDAHAALRAPRLPSGLDDSDPPGVGAGLRLEVDAEEGGLAACIREEREGLAVDRALDRRGVEHVLDEDPGDVADARLRRMPGDGGFLGRGRYVSCEEGAERGEGDPGPGHSGRCWRRNCSISATSSDAGGRSLFAGAAGVVSSSSWVSRDSSFLT